MVDDEPITQGRIFMLNARWISRLIAPLLLVVAASESCRAGAIVYDYGGVIQSVGNDTGMTPGMRFSGTFTYDPDTATSVLSAPGHTQFQYGSDDPSGPSVLTLNVGGDSVIGPMQAAAYSLYQNWEAGPPSSQLWIWNASNQQSGTRQISLFFGNTGQAVFQGTNDATRLPSVLNLADFTDATIITSLPGLNGDVSQVFSGKIDTLSVVSTPEPSSLALMGLIAAMAIARGANQKRKITVAKV